MKKSILRTFVLLALIFCCVLVTSCKKGDDSSNDDQSNVQDNNNNNNNQNQGGQTYTITYELNGGTISGQATSYDGSKDIILVTPTREGYTFGGWFENSDCTGSPVTKLPKGQSGAKTYYAKWNQSVVTGTTSKWPLNQIGFNGGGAKFGIKVLPVAEFDPLNAGYTGDSKALKQAHLNAVEAAYDIDIEYVAYGDDEAWGPTRVKAINDSYLDGSYLAENIYVVNISSQWIPTLVRGNSLTSLETYFANAGYEQNSAINQSVTVKRKIYGYQTGAARPDYFMYYNVTKVASIGMEDPAELWFKGEWTWSKFDAWVKDAQTKLGENQFAIDCGYAEFSIGAVAAQGQQMIDSKGKVMFTRSAVTQVFDQMQSYYRSGYWDKGHGVQDVATNFKLGNTLLHTGSLWFLKEPTRFTPEGMEGGIDFKIGVVPYPIADNQEVTVHTAPYTYYDTEGNEVSVEEPIIGRNNTPLTTKSGEQIYGVDYTSTSFQMPYTGGTCYSFMNYDNTPSGITSEIAYNIMYDLNSGMIDDPEYAGITADEGYETYLMKKFDYQLDIDVVMSVQDESLSYYELMEVASMTVGDGSHFGNGYWAFASQLITGSDTPKTKLDEQKPIYEAALIEIGF